ncbi:hypothetical protein ACFQZO_10180 [Bradyrhizobium sp. GCM10027634]|uniref:hypothetical protein n=1 Tax=unclassified Bradyrhizobium TaxID=2631580 RepID=UPI00263BE615|nr:hypothetical protein [Bradyrhizobium sp. WYCCWR 12677]MDN5001251.1 hypothetical protein [Bradyrhizobium sp. WYCCWR 12677]
MDRQNVVARDARASKAAKMPGGVGIITIDEARQAAIVAAESTAGVKEVHDHLRSVDTYSEFYVESPEDIKAAS